MHFDPSVLNGHKEDDEDVLLGSRLLKGRFSFGPQHFYVSFTSFLFIVGLVGLVFGITPCFISSN
jgi:hypothetical protein